MEVLYLTALGRFVSLGPRRAQGYVSQSGAPVRVSWIYDWPKEISHAMALTNEAYVFHIMTATLP